MVAYYNEHDHYAAQWLRNLVEAGHIAPGDVDTRSIVDVRPADLDGYTQCHFFAGIGGWSLALRLAGWPDDLPVWTGSCPCQPFSGAGKRAGFDDERHLWPTWFGLIAECRPGVVFGEQVASKDGLGWLDLVQADLEGAGYACGAADLCAASIGAPHIRQRLWFVADANGRHASAEGVQRGREHRQQPQDGGARVALADVLGTGLEGRDARPLGIECATAERGGAASSLEHAPSEQVGLSGCAWFDGRPADFIPCRDGKARPVEPGTFPLAHGIPNRVGRLRAYGNAIVPQVAAEFIAAYGEARVAA